MRNIISKSLCVILLIVGVSCSKSDESNNELKGAAENIKYLGITDATNLIIAAIIFHMFYVPFGATDIPFPFPRMGVFVV